MRSHWDPGLAQDPREPACEFLDRFMHNMETYYSPGFFGYAQLDLFKYVVIFLDNSTSEEQFELACMAGGSLLNCTASEVWSLILERAEYTRSYSEYNSEQPYEEEDSLLAQNIYEFIRETKEALFELCKMISLVSKDMEELKRSPPWLSPEPTEFFVDDSEVTVAIDEHEDEIMVEKDLHIEPACTDNILAKELIPSLCSDMIIQPDIVRTCIFTLPPITNMFLSSHLQDHVIKGAVSKDKVWCSYEEVESYTSLTKACKQVSSSNKFFDKLRINWKSRKKSKRKVLNRGESRFFVPKLRTDRTFVWKPGWDPWRTISDKGAKMVRKGVRKFDGAHPWDPNIW